MYNTAPAGVCRMAEGGDLLCGGLVHRRTIAEKG
jgi:hypothetical protein